jgi:hypothetical protein
MYLSLRLLGRVQPNRYLSGTSMLKGCFISRKAAKLRAKNYVCAWIYSRHDIETVLFANNLFILQRSVRLLFPMRLRNK